MAWSVGVTRFRPIAAPRHSFAFARLGRVLSQWRRLTEDQRAAWAIPAQHVQSRPRVGQSGHLSGYLIFILGVLGRARGFLSGFAS